MDTALPTSPVSEVACASSGQVYRHLHKARRTLNLGTTLELLARWLVPWAYGAAAAVILVRSGLFSVAATPVWLYLSLGVALLAVLWHARKQRWSLEDTAAYLDLKGQAGGQVMAFVEADGGATISVSAHVLQKSPTLHLRPLLRPLLVPMLLLWASYLIPQRTVPLSPSMKPMVQASRQMAEQVTELEALGLLETQTASQLQEQLKDLERPITSPESAMEAMDEMRGRLQRELAQSRLELETSLGAASALKTHLTSEGGEDAQGKSSQGRPATTATIDSQARTLSLLEESLRGLPPTEALPKELHQALLQAMAEAGVTPGAPLSDAQREAVASALTRAQSKETLRSLSSAMAELQSQRLVTLSEAVPGFGEDVKGQWMTGASRGLDGDGPAPAPLLLGQESDATDARFKPVVLPPGRRPTPSEVVRILRSDPTTQKNQTPQAVERRGLSNGPPTQGDQEAMPLSPYQQDVSSRYFSPQTSRAPQAQQLPPAAGMNQTEPPQATQETP